jgi:hypothetical protein
MRNRFFGAVAFIAVAAALASCTPSRSDNRFGGGDSSREMGRPGFRTAAERVEGRLAFLHAELKITRAQEARWDPFAAALRADAVARDEMRRSLRGQGRARTAPERLDRMERIMAFQRDQLRKLNAPTKSLYAALAPAQRRTANELLERELVGRAMGGMMNAGHGMGARVEGQLAELRAELKIAPTQEAAWTSFANAMRAQARAAQRAHGPMMARMGHDGHMAHRTTGNLPARLDEADKMLAAHIAGLREHKNALAGLYAALTSEQKDVLDRHGRRRGDGPRRGPMMM